MRVYSADVCVCADEKARVWKNEIGGKVNGVDQSKQLSDDVKPVNIRNKNVKNMFFPIQAHVLYPS